MPFTINVTPFPLLDSREWPWSIQEWLRKLQVAVVTVAAGAGDVTGPASSTAGRIALFDGTTGKLLKELGSSGTTTTLLHGNASGSPTFAAVSLTADVSGILPSANGGAILYSYYELGGF